MGFVSLQLSIMHREKSSAFIIIHGWHKHENNYTKEEKNNISQEML
jgi:hypothetical protein